MKYPLLLLTLLFVFNPSYGQVVGSSITILNATSDDITISTAKRNIMSNTNINWTTEGHFTISRGTGSNCFGSDQLTHIGIYLKGLPIYISKEGSASISKLPSTRLFRSTNEIFTFKNAEKLDRNFDSQDYRSGFDWDQKKLEFFKGSGTNRKVLDLSSSVKPGTFCLIDLSKLGRLKKIIISKEDGKYVIQMI